MILDSKIIPTDARYPKIRTNMKGFPNHKQVVEGLFGMLQGSVGVFFD